MKPTALILIGMLIGFALTFAYARLSQGEWIYHYKQRTQCLAGARFDGLIWERAVEKCGK